MESSYAAASVSGTSNVGGVTGLIEDVDDKSKTADLYWDSDIGPNATSGDATSLTTSEMQGSSASSNMSNFDFTNVWTANSGSYPELQD